jgi:hypothetical protein
MKMKDEEKKEEEKEKSEVNLVQAWAHYYSQAENAQRAGLEQKEMQQNNDAEIDYRQHKERRGVDEV